MNYDSIGSLRYLAPYMISNNTQRKYLRKFIRKANQREDIHFVFVSNWLHLAAENDLQIGIKNYHIIPNGIDTSLFSFSKKQPELRKKILLLRSFKANNYANDLAIEAIQSLSRRPFFNDLEFCIQGEGYLFNQLTSKVKKFNNVKLKNFFVENKFIPQIHRDFGIFLCPSRLDTQGVSMCEAMASGLVPVTCPIGGITEYSEDQISGFHIQSSEEIASKIEFLYDNPLEFIRISQQARDAIVKKCSLVDTVKMEIDIFNTLV